MKEAFKIGDKVKVIDKSRSKDSVQLFGKICTVKKVEDRHLTVEEEYDEKVFPKGPSGIWFTEIELVKEATAPAITKNEGWGFE